MSGNQHISQGGATSARLYDALLDGKNAWPTDDKAARAVLEVAPNVALIARNNRQFLRRAVHYLVAEAGIRQILDIGVGMPAEPNVHQVAQAVSRDTRVVYVDNDPNVNAHAQALLRDCTPEGDVAFLDADLCDPDAILAAPAVGDTLDFSQPIALLLVSVPLFIPDDRNPHGIVRRLVSELPSGSYLALSQGTYDHAPEQIAAMSRVYGEFGIKVQPRSHETITRFFTDNGLELVEPGLVATNQWRPDEPFTTTADSCIWAGVGRKP